MDEQEPVDVAVIGGGVAGCYLGYRLSTADPPPVVAIYEAADRIGGRLCSAELPGAPGLVADLGGMRFHDELHIVVDLIGHLGLASQVAEFSFGEPENFAYVRGVRLRLRQLTGDALARDPDCLPYRLRPGERGQGIDGLLARVTEAAVPGFAALRARYHAAFAHQRWQEARAAACDYDEARHASRIRGSPLHDTSWWAVLCDTLSQEAVHFVQDAGGYETLASCGNAASWIDTLFHAPLDARYRRLTGGYEALPRALHARFRAAGGRIRTRHRLQRFDRAGDGRGYELVFQRGDPGGFARVRARTLVLTLPPHALERLEQDTFFFRDPALQRHLRSVKPIRATKLFLAYPSAWWQRAGVARGRSTTDLPLRQLWYGPSGAAPGDPALLLAAYTNGAAADYWSGLAHGEPYPDPPGTPAPDSPARPATRAMVERAHAMVMDLHGIAAAPPPHAARFQDWSLDPHGGGWHVWREGCDARQIIPAMRQPLADEAVYVASDCWSHDPGSVQGSLAAAECVLQDHLGVPWPGWLRRGGTDLGPRRGGRVDGR